MKKIIPVLGLFLLSLGCGSSSESKKEEEKDKIQEIKKQLIGRWVSKMDGYGEEQNTFYFETDSTGSFSWKQETKTNDPYSSGMTTMYLLCEGEITWDVQSVDSLKHSESGLPNPYVDKALVVKTSSIRGDGRNAYYKFPQGWFESKESDFEDRTFVIPILSSSGDSLQLTNQDDPGVSDFFETNYIRKYAKEKN